MYNSLFKITRKLNLGFLLLVIHPKSALNSTGWFKSFRKSKVIDKNNNPIPWWTYSFIDFIQGRLTKEHRVLEFGCGFSTIYLSKKVKEVLAFEDYPSWAKEISTKIDANSSIIEVTSIPDFNSYSHLIKGKFDVMIIDNLGDRINTAIANMHHLNENGVVIWDNTDGPDWNEIWGLMLVNGFKEISFTGMVPQELNMSKTTIFYRSNNCLGI